MVFNYSIVTGGPDLALPYFIISGKLIMYGGQKLASFTSAKMIIIYLIIKRQQVVSR